MKRASVGLLVWGALALGAFVGCGPSVQYPNCETDDQCKKDANGGAINEYCVNQKCQECREDRHCDMGFACQNGRCEKKSECPCTAPAVCQNDKCVQPECVTNEDCPEGKKCENNACVGGCTTDQECGGGMTCVDGNCQAAQTEKISSQCQPVDAASGQVVALETVRFEFDKADLLPESQSTLEKNAECLKQAPEIKVVVEGHCDERGTQEYNLALGERRAASVRSFLENLGVTGDRLRIVSKGKNEPLCREGDESCYGKNRRVEFIQKR